MKEEMCASSRVSLAINEEGQTLSMNKDLQGGIPYSRLHDIIRVSFLILLFAGCMELGYKFPGKVLGWMKLHIIFVLGIQPFNSLCL